MRPFNYKLVSRPLGCKITCGIWKAVETIITSPVVCATAKKRLFSLVNIFKFTPVWAPIDSIVPFSVSICHTIDKISSLSCQKVADSITTSEMGNNVAKQASVLLRNILEYIRRYPSAYCTILFLVDKSNPYTARRGVVVTSPYKKLVMHGHTIRSAFCFPFSSFFYFGLFIL